MLKMQCCGTHLANCRISDFSGCDQGFEFVFYGDSITERWRGTEMDNPAPEGPACVKSFDKNFGDLRTALLAISGADLSAALVQPASQTFLPPCVQLAIMSTKYPSPFAFVQARALQGTRQDICCGGCSMGSCQRHTPQRRPSC